MLALIVLGLAWELWLSPTGRGTLALKVLPLAFAVTGLLKMRLYTYRWLSLLVWLYFTEGVVRASTETGIGMVLALVEVALSVLLFVACSWHVRARFKNRAALAAG
ncbi:putative membrane protein [Rivibacter subsaxonicus]|uniref:Putative membrane protein n=1 Tax=Rivibacter subsaxonicus TaxID=457575 RepID=A0A4Q7VCV5_9BURK|nr:putative membrane protein [Rivibacter subsaxonicus]